MTGFNIKVSRSETEFLSATYLPLSQNRCFLTQTLFQLAKTWFSFCFSITQWSSSHTPVEVVCTLTLQHTPEIQWN